MSIPASIEVSTLDKISSDLLTRRQERRAVRWYVWVLPACHRGPARGLQAELDRRIRAGEPTFEFFAPSYVETKEVKGVLVKTSRPLLYNYVFVRASEEELYRLKQRLPFYNFLPRVKEGEWSHYPYLSDDAMRNLRWVARSYSDSLPVYIPEPDQLMEGDRVRITEGRFKGAEARVIARPGVGRKEVMVCVDNCLWVPLLRVQAGEYEIIALHTGRKHVYTCLDNERLLEELHQALGRYYGPEGVSEQDCDRAREALRRYGSLRMDSDVMRCKQYAYLLPARTILGEQAECEKLIGTIRAMLPLVRAEQSRALLLVTLFGCTDNRLYYDLAHTLVDPWRRESTSKRSKQLLLRHLEDYDRWLGHGGL